MNDTLAKLDDFLLKVQTLAARVPESDTQADNDNGLRRTNEYLKMRKIEDKKEIDELQRKGEELKTENQAARIEVDEIKKQIEYHVAKIEGNEEVQHSISSAYPKNLSSDHLNFVF